MESLLCVATCMFVASAMFGIECVRKACGITADLAQSDHASDRDALAAPTMIGQ